MSLDKEDVYFSKIFILQSLENERRTGNEIELKIKYVSYKEKSIKVELIDLNLISEFFAILNKIKDEISRGELPFIHFEIHGSKEGFVLSGGELIKWSDLKEPIREINILTKNNLFISLATCFGAHLLKIYKYDEPCPFYGYIAPMTEVLNLELENSYSAFFETLLTENDFSKAIEILLTTAPTNGNKYAYLNCYSYFDTLSSLYKEEISNPEILKTRAEEIVKKFKERYPHLNLSEEEVKKEFQKLPLRTLVNETLEKARRIFLHESLV